MGTDVSEISIGTEVSHIPIGMEKAHIVNHPGRTGRTPIRRDDSNPFMDTSRRSAVPAIRRDVSNPFMDTAIPVAPRRPAESNPYMQTEKSRAEVAAAEWPSAPESTEWSRQAATVRSPPADWSIKPQAPPRAGGSPSMESEDASTTAGTELSTFEGKKDYGKPENQSALDQGLGKEGWSEDEEDFDDEDYDEDDPYSHLPPEEADILRAQIQLPGFKKGAGIIYRYASRNDKLILSLSTICSIASGAAMPIMTVIFGRLVREQLGTTLRYGARY
jgi:hypothetical protein